MNGMMRLATMAITIASLSTQALAQHEGHHGATGDSAVVAAMVASYHAALVAGDSAGALALLSDDAVILESGGVETRAQYRSHHLPADINASRSSKSERGPVHVRLHGEVAWATSTSTSQREVNGVASTTSMAELMVLVKSGGSWKITAIHWSSRSRRAG